LAKTEVVKDEAQIRISFPASLAAYHSLSAVLRDTLFWRVDFQDTGPPFSMRMYPVCDLRVLRSACNWGGISKPPVD